MRKIPLLILCMQWGNSHSGDPQHYQLYMLGHYNLLEQRPQKSFECYKKLLSDSQSPYPYSGFIRFLYATNQSKAILSLLPQVDKVFENDVELQLIFSQALAAEGQAEKADDRITALQQKHKNHLELTYLAAQAHSKKDPKRAIEVIDEYLNTSPFQPKNCLFYFLESQLYLSMNNKDKAIESVKKSLELCPRFDKGWLFLGMLHEQEGKITEAIKGYTTFLELVGPHKAVEQQINALLIKAKLQGNALESANTPKTVPCMVNAMTYYENGAYDRALITIDQCLKEFPDHQEAKLFKIHVLSAMGNLSSALNLLQGWLLEAPGNELWFKTLLLLCQAGLDKSRAIEVLQTVERKYPTNGTVLLYLADLHTRARLFTTALTYHEKALKVVNDLMLKTKILFNMGLIHYETEDFNAMRTVLERGHGLNAAFPPLNNLLAYYYATSGHDLKGAQKYLDQALAKDAHNAHFLDTQAMIWYKQREYKKAAELLEQLSAEEPNDYFIRMHLAKAHIKLGARNRGLTELEKARTLARTEHEKAACHKMLKLIDA